MESSQRRPLGGGFQWVQRRELGPSQPVAFTRRVGGSEVLVKQLTLYGKLNGHGGCVNTVHFNPSGDLLISGSDDEQVIFWNWTAKSKKFSYHSGHSGNVFQARVMPFSDDRTVITSAADGQIRLGKISEDGRSNTKKLGTHRGRVHKLAIEPGSPHIFYSCGEDGFVRHFDLRSSTATKLFLCSSFTESKQPIQLNAIAIDPRNPHYFSVGGFDEYARVYDIRNCQWDSSSNADRPVNTFCPRHLIGSGNMHITGLAYSNTSEVLVSYNDELVYLFQKDMGIGPNPSSTDGLPEIGQPQVYSGHRNSRTVKGVSFFGPNDEYVVSGSDCGHVFIWRKKGGQLVRLMVGDKNIVNCIEPHPHIPFLATSGLERNVKLWMPTAKKPAALPSNLEQILESNRRGREDHARITLSPDVIMHVLRLQRRQALAHVERRRSGDGAESDDDGDDEGEAFVLRFTDSDDGSEAGFTGDARECTIC
uniref:DDB1-and CUL4-associated factor 8 n=1 Tax=Anthurium amnicola TaxID=1678845 RepID=A0A1D1Y1C5_9ARAE